MAEFPTADWSWIDAAVVTAVAFSPNSKTILTAVNSVLIDGVRTPGRAEAWLWDASTGKQIGVPMRGIHEAVFSPDSRTVLGLGSLAWLWNASTGKPIGGPWRGGSIGQMMFSPDGRMVLTRSGTVAAASVRIAARSRSSGRALSPMWKRIVAGCRTAPR